MSFDTMTKIAGAPSKTTAMPGMAHFAGTGPEGTFCGGCVFRGYNRQSAGAYWDAERKEYLTSTYWVAKCEKHFKLTGKHGKDVRTDYPSCKYFEAVETKEKKDE